MRDEYPPANVPQGTEKPQWPIKRRLTPVPVSAGEDARINETGLRLLINTAANSDKNGWCWLTQEQHADLAGRNRNTVGRTLRKLAEWGYLLVGHDLYDPDRKRKRKTVYRINA